MNKPINAGLTADQVEARSKGLGGSDAAAALGVHEYRTPVDVWMEKTGRAEPPDLSDIQAVYFGHVLEDVVAREYARRTGKRVAKVNRTLYHPDDNCLLAHIDRRIVGDRKRILECKTAGAYVSGRWGEEGTDQVPDEYLVQVMHYLAITGARVADIAVLIGGNDFRIYTVSRDEELIASIIEQERAFWHENVEKDIPPAPVTAKDLMQLYPRDNAGEIMADDQTLSTWAELKSVRDAIKEFAKRRDELELTLKQAMGENAVLVDETNRPLATWRTQTSKRIDTKSLREDLPEIAESFSYEQTTRVLRIK